MRIVKRWANPTIIGVAFLVGLAIRWSLVGHVSDDARGSLLPWYEFVRAHGLASLRVPFTNYAPYYTYMLLGLTRLRHVASPLALIKAASGVFELGCAIIVSRMVVMTGAGRQAGAMAFVSVWLAPTVLLNGPFWAQSDSVWTFFVLVSLWLFMRARNGVPSFAFAFAVKAQSVFFGPFILGMMFKRRALWVWVAVIPAVYVVMAVPLLLYGRSLASILNIYVDQANTYHTLSANAANIWIFGSVSETTGVVIGLMLAGIAGLFLAALTARVSIDDHEGLLVAACASLLLMPFLLPKMHDRYFYALEIASVALACSNPRYAGLALMAQANGILSYMMFDESLPLASLTPAALCNGGMAVLLVVQMVKPQPNRRLSPAHLAAFVGAAAVVLLYLLMTRLRGGALGWYPAFAGAYILAGMLLLLDIRRGGAAVKACVPEPA